MKRSILYLALMAIISSCSHPTENGQETQDSKAVKVKTEIVKTVAGSPILRYSGTIEPSQTIPLTFQSTGIVQSVLVQAGDMVHKGQLLATVDKADNQSMLDAAVATYNRAKDAYDRLKSVHDKGSLTELKWVEMETNLKQAESQVQLAKSNIEKCYMRAPENGMIGSRNVEPGQSAIAATAPLEIVKIESVAVKVSVPESEISKIKKGLKASFTISALDGRTFEGQVSSVGVVADKVSRTYEVKILVNNPKMEIKPGMVCDVMLDSGAPNTQVVVANTAVTRNSNGETFVFVVSNDNKTVKKQTVSVGNYNENGIVIVAGLTPGNTIVVDGKEKLNDNSLISLSN